MPIPFGVSVGDFIAGIDFIYSLCDALESSSGSKAQYQGVVSAFKSISDGLSQLEGIEATVEEQLAVSQVIDRIKQTVVAFEVKVSKYEASLGRDHSPKWWKSFARKIQWQRYSKQDVLWFQNELLQHGSALQMIIAKIQRYVSSFFEIAMANQHSTATGKANQETQEQFVRVHDQLIGAATASQTSFTQVEFAVCSRIKQCEAGAQRRHEQSESAAEARFHETRTDALERFDQSEAAAQARFNISMALALHMYRDLMRRLSIFLLCILNAISLLERSLTQMPRRMLTQASTIFEDAHGYIFYINAQFVQTWRVSMNSGTVYFWLSAVIGIRVRVAGQLQR